MKKILFKAEMVRAILEGNKTQTRRIHKDMSKPRYNVGETVYVGEAYALFPLDAEYDFGEAYALFPLDAEYDFGWDVQYKADTPSDELDFYTWKAGMFMPEKYSRIKLKIVKAEKEKLKDFNCEKARAEGFENDWKFKYYFERINGELKGETEVWAYTFEVVKNDKA